MGLRDLLEQKSALYSEIDELDRMMALHLGARRNDAYEASKQLKIVYQSKLESIEERLCNAESKMPEEKEIFLKDISDNRIWHLKADTAKWRVPGERYEDEESDDEEDYGGESQASWS